MRLKRLSVFALLLLSTVSLAEEVQQQSQDNLIWQIVPTKEVEVAQINFNDLPNESQIGSLGDHVKKDKNELDSSPSIDCQLKELELCPQAQGHAYMNGISFHVANYSQCIIYTLLGGPRCGLQITTNYYDEVLYTNYDYEEKQTPKGIALQHYYPDAKVITGGDQVIIFH